MSLRRGQTCTAPGSMQGLPWPTIMIQEGDAMTPIKPPTSTRADMGSDRLLISIVIPTFRRESLLRPLLLALDAQVADSGAAVEIIVVDNSPEASAIAALAGEDSPLLRLVHEPNPGVANARNRGVATATGSHVLFLDDDELPAEGWLATFAAEAAAGTPACFGSIEPVFAAEPPAELRAPLERLFSRRISAPAGADVSSLRAYLGSGNSMFSRDVLALVDPPFDPAFNTGGEDVWLLRKLVDTHRIPLRWRPEAKVSEIVPQGRATLEFLRKRRFGDGQLRCLVESGAGGVAGAFRVAFWMTVGAAQLGLHGLAALAAKPFSARRWVRHHLGAVGGAGKLMWWRR